MDYSGFADLPVIDAHVHFVHPERLEEMRALLKETRTPRLNLVCIPNPDVTTHNPAALFFKKKHPKQVYISGALDYTPLLQDPSQAPGRLAEQVAALKASGFDGLKLIEGKPEVRKLLPYPLDGPLYAPLWAALEQEQLPVVFHVADPDEFWDPEHCPAWAREAGWDYSAGGFPSKEDLNAEVEAILERHPNLKITFAHFYFLSRQPERAGRFLDAHPNVCFDLAPHMDLYRDFSRDPANWRAFFLCYPERILYGTDLDTRLLARGQSAFMRFIPWLIRSMLERNEVFSAPDGTVYHGLGLPTDVLEKIYYLNFERIYGSQPASLPPPR